MIRFFFVMLALCLLVADASACHRRRHRSSNASYATAETGCSTGQCAVPAEPVVANAIFNQPRAALFTTPAESYRTGFFSRRGGCAGGRCGR